MLRRNRTRPHCQAPKIKQPTYKVGTVCVFEVVLVVFYKVVVDNDDLGNYNAAYLVVGKYVEKRTRSVTVDHNDLGKCIQ